MAEISLPNAVPTGLRENRTTVNPPLQIKSITKTEEYKEQRLLIEEELLTEEEKPTKKHFNYRQGQPPLELAQQLRDLITKSKPDFKQPNIQEWASEMGLLLNYDKRNLDTARKLMIWASQDSFWKAQILDAKAFRRNFDKMEVKMKTPQPGQTTPAAPVIRGADGLTARERLRLKWERDRDGK